MKLDELKGVASSMGITGTTKMRKSDLVEAIKARQAGGSSPAATSDAAPARASRRASRPAGSAAATEAPAEAPASTPDSVPATPTAEAPSVDSRERARRAEGDGRQDAPAAERTRRTQRTEPTEPTQPTEPDGPTGATEPTEPTEPTDRVERPERSDERAEGGDDREGRQRDRARQSDRSERTERRAQGERPNERGQQDRQQQGNRDGRVQGDRQNDRQYDRGQQDRQDRQPDRQQDRQDRQQDRQDRQPDRQDRQPGDAGDQNRGQSRFDDDDRAGSRRSRNRQRSRDRKRGRGREGGQDWNETELQVGDDDVLVPVGGILDVLDNYAFVRTSGYLAGPNDVYVPLGIVKKNGLRKGDAVTGAVKALREGEQPSGNVGRQKFNALVRLDTVNGMTPEEAAKRVEFGKLTPLYPQQRLRLETESNVLTTRIIDLVAPIGKGQRGLIVAPAKAGKTMIMQTLANAITTNNPECHLMVVLVDERPEEVTDMQRAVKGEVISSTFDRPAEDHTTVAELAIERAKRLVELGHDVVVLLDSITKLGRAYNLAAPASGRILSGGVDSAALYPPKKFFGAARNIENGGSLTILATALVETGSKMDEVIFEEFKGTGNMELRLNRDLANRRIFPAVDINSSGTRREEILLATEELKIMWKLRRVLAALDPQQAIELLIDRLKKTKTNYEFLTQVQQTSSARLDDES